MSNDLNEIVWVFTGEEGALPSGVFLDLYAAEQWIATNALSGILTGYPPNQGVYHWAVQQGFFQPIKPFQKTPAFVGRFNSAYLQHWHYVEGRRRAPGNLQELEQQANPETVGLGTN